MYVDEYHSPDMLKSNANQDNQIIGVISHCERYIFASL